MAKSLKGPVLLAVAVIAAGVVGEAMAKKIDKAVTPDPTSTVQVAGSESPTPSATPTRKK